MDQLKKLGMAALGAMALMAIVAGTASATTFETTGITENGEITVTASKKSGTSGVLSRTDGSLANTCTSEHVHYRTTSYTPVPRAPVQQWALAGCTRPVTVDQAGEFSFELIAGTTNATVISSNAEITVSTPFGTVNCKTGTGTDLGVLIGVAAGNASMEINSVLNCGFLLPSASYVSKWVITGPHGLGVTS